MKVEYRIGAEVFEPSSSIKITGIRKTRPDFRMPWASMIATSTLFGLFVGLMIYVLLRSQA